MTNESRKPIIDDEAIEELTTRAIEIIYPSPDDLAAELRSGQVLTAYIGIDPTDPNLHVGHESQLLKLQRLQKLGHNVILLIGDFTGMIGDPSDKSATRVKLTRRQVLENAEGYKEQAGKIIDFDDPVNPAQLRYNSEWLSKMAFEDVVELASELTVQQMIERDMFRRRIAEQNPVWLHEFLYPLMQGWDSVAMKVDIEVGGSDQIFNMRVGSTLVRRYLNKQKFVIAGKLLVDPTGRKIGKSEGNMITLTDKPADMFHKVMMWSDEITPHALELCTQLPMDEITKLASDFETGRVSGLDAKRLLARTMVAELHGAEAAQQAEDLYNALTTGDTNIDPETLIKIEVKPGQSIVDILFDCGIAVSKSAARRLVQGGGVRIDGNKVTDLDWKIESEAGTIILQSGKKKLGNFRRLDIVDE